MTMCWLGSSSSSRPCVMAATRAGSGAARGFSLVTVAAGLDQPTAFAFKGPKILVTEKASGEVQVVLPNGSLRPTAVRDAEA